MEGDLIHISSAPVGEAVAVEETQAGQWQVRFFDMPIGVIDQEHRKLRPRAVPARGNGGGASNQNMKNCHPCIRSVSLPM
jgi:hypothetical protein